MFNLYDYLKSKLKNFPEVNTLGRSSGIAGMEELIANIRELKGKVLVVEDEADGYLDLSGHNLNHSNWVFYVLDIVAINNPEDRLRTFKECKATGLKILNTLLCDSNGFGDPCYGIDFSRIDYQKVGPLVKNTFGFMFTVTMQDENFNLLQEPPELNDPVP